MLIGVPKEIKVHEYRVGLTPDNIRSLPVNIERLAISADWSLERYWYRAHQRRQ